MVYNKDALIVMLIVQILVKNILHIYIYIYLYTCVCVCVCVCVK